MKITLKSLDDPRSELLSCIRQAVRSAIDPASGRDPLEQVHILRVTCKRMRSYLRMVRPRMKRSDFRKENRTLRDLNRLLSTSRDAQVLCDTLRLVCDQLNPETQSCACDQLRPELPVPPDVSDYPEIQTVGTGLEAFLQRADHFLPPPEKGWPYLRDGFHLTFHQANDGYREALQSRKAEDFHEWRKTLKYLRFQTELLLDIESLIIPGMHDTLIDLERSLGQHHDTFLLAQHVAAQRNRNDLEPDLVETVMFETGKRSESLEKDILAKARRLFVSEGPDLLTVIDDQLEHF